MNTTESIQARITFQITDPPMDIAAVRRAAARMDGMLAPSVLSHLAEPPALPGMLFTHLPIYRSIPTALFTQNPKLGIAQLPPNWIDFYLAWASRLKRSKQLTKAITSMRQGKDFEGNRDAFADPLVAALMLFAFSPAPGSDLRRALFDAALKMPLGAYVCAESLHSLSEQQAIVEALPEDSLALLGASCIQSFAAMCLPYAMSHHDLPSGLVVARLGTDADLTSWLRAGGVAACEGSAGAATMLVLNPTAPKGLHALWLDTLRRTGNAADAFATALWARHTWAPSTWSLLKSDLKHIAISDGKAGWFNWFAQIESESAIEALAQDADALWSFELLHALNLNSDSLRFRLADRLGRLTYDWEANLVLSALENRQQLRR